MEVVIISDLAADMYISKLDLQQLDVLTPDFPNRVTTARIAAVTPPPAASSPSSTCSPPASAAAALKAEILQEFADIFSDKLDGRALTGVPMTINLKEGASIYPKRVCTARQVPLHLQEDAEALVQQLLDGGVIVPVHEPTEWISPAHFVPKPAGSGVRLVTDYTQLNKYVQRPVHPFPSTQDIIRNIKPTDVVFAKMDAVQGYFQIPLQEESSLLTTFLLPSGRYRYTRAPYGA